MFDNIPKISVLVITYNQQDVISRAIESLLSQKDYIYEICVSDDCSKDRTWEILQDYSGKYPGLFVLNRNEPNVGIFENIEKTWTMPTGDIVYQLSGDDACGDGWFEKVVEIIKEKNIDFKNEQFCVYGDFKEIYPNGATITHSQSIAGKNKDILKLAIRGLVVNRGTAFSKRVLEKYQKVSKGRSYVVECAQDRQLQLFSKVNYYIPQVGNIYYAAIGISAHSTSHIIDEQSGEWDYLQLFLERNGVILDKKDKNFIKFRNALFTGNKFKILYFWLKSLDINILMQELLSYKMRIIKRTPFFKGDL